MIDESQIGRRIKQVREEKRMTQSGLASAAKISPTQLSGYENGKVPSLTTLAKIAHELGTSIDRLYYGDESEAFITSAADDGHIVVNCFCELFGKRVLTAVLPLSRKTIDTVRDNDLHGVVILVERYEEAIERLFSNLNEYMDKFDTYQNPSDYLKQVRESVAKEVNARKEYLDLLG